MSQVQLSVEEYFTNSSLNDSGIEDLLATPWIVPEPEGSSSIDDESNAFDPKEYIGERENKFWKFKNILFSYIGSEDLKFGKNEFDVYLPGYENPICKNYFNR